VEQQAGYFSHSDAGCWTNRPRPYRETVIGSHRPQSSLSAPRRAFRRVVAAAGMDPMPWTPRELRRSFVSLLSSSGMPIEDIAHLVGHANTLVTELVYRKELCPVLIRSRRDGCVLFPDDESARTLASKSQSDEPEGVDDDDKRRPDQGWLRGLEPDLFHC
jgi:hypothetical protein